MAKSKTIPNNPEPHKILNDFISDISNEIVSSDDSDGSIISE